MEKTVRTRTRDAQAPDLARMGAVASLAPWDGQAPAARDHPRALLQRQRIERCFGAGVAGPAVQRHTAPVQLNSVADRKNFGLLEKGQSSITFSEPTASFAPDGVTLLVAKTAANVWLAATGKAMVGTALTLTTALDRVGRFELVIPNPGNPTKQHTLTVHVVNRDAERANTAATRVEIVGCALVLEQDADPLHAPPWPDVKVFLDSHQNKHQHPNTMIAELGTWKSEKGSTFKKGRGLGWHGNNTAHTMRDWALSLGLVDGQERVAVKEAMDDGYIYDAKAQQAGGLLNVTYHCNPPVSE